MSNPAYFVQNCPTCGRSLHIRVEYLGRAVVCQHCRARFEAYDPSCTPVPPSDSSIHVLQRADELLEMAARQSRSLPR